jgi:thymidylate synthase (FAD)
MITIVKPKVSILTPEDVVEDIPTTLEWAGRTCYKSHDRTKNGSAEKFVRMICRNHHESVLEHSSISVRVVCSRACSHQLVRHRLASYSQESQRYVNYDQKGFQFICPPSVGLVTGEYDYTCHPTMYCPQDWYLKQGEDDKLIERGCPSEWLSALHYAKRGYLEASKHIKPEDARYLLPNATRTELVVTANLRMWRHIFRERALNPKAQWEIRGIFLQLLEKLTEDLPSVFEDLTEE